MQVNSALTSENRAVVARSCSAKNLHTIMIKCNEKTSSSNAALHTKGKFQVNATQNYYSHEVFTDTGKTAHFFRQIVSTRRNRLCKSGKNPSDLLENTFA